MELCDSHKNKLPFRWHYRGLFRETRVGDKTNVTPATDVMQMKWCESLKLPGKNNKCYFTLYNSNVHMNSCVCAWSPYTRTSHTANAVCDFAYTQYTSHQRETRQMDKIERNTEWNCVSHGNEQWTRARVWVYTSTIYIYLVWYVDLFDLILLSIYLKYAQH